MKRYFRIVGRVWPQKLKYRLFTAFLLFIFIPFFLLQLYNYQQIERSISNEFASKAYEQLELLQQSMTDVLAKMFRNYITLEQLPVAKQWLQGGSELSEQEREAIFRELIKSLPNTFPEHVVYKVADLHGNLYASAPQSMDESYNEFASNSRFEQLRSTGAFYVWDADTQFSLYSLLVDEQAGTIGYLLIQFNYSQWLGTMSRSMLLQQVYYLIDDQGEVKAATDARYPIEAALLGELIVKEEAEPIITTQDYTSIVRWTSIHEFEWRMISRLPLNHYISNFNDIRRQFISTFLLLGVVFVLITFVMTTTMTRQLLLLKKRMSEIAAKELKTSMPEGNYRGEVHDLAVAFNQMLRDMKELLQRLKLEERERESVRYQMLMAQMNPHFLLNTLNTIKWSALDKDDEETAEICMALGHLLEATLNSDLELVFLKDELDLLRSYIYIQNVRYEGQITYQEHVEEGLDYALVPKLSMQPLAENAIKHGFAYSPHDARMNLHVRRSGKSLEMVFEDNGKGVEQADSPQQPGKRSGIGLANLRERLRLLFREEGELQLLRSSGGTTVRASFPLLISNPYRKKESTYVESDHS
ncbi:sensor histidine kinase [Paenibacillus sp. NRS-1760]|uniref:sensor histidine kinase n=1 Tax=Paenibacillus sp. NRS-1760 TaxID=3233902 RepID=UPI003D2C3723